MKKTCPECGEAIIGRADKKFCSDMCRNAFNNKQNSDATNLIRNINNALRKNRRILLNLCPIGKAKIKTKTMLENGFDFKRITSFRQTKKGIFYLYVYDYAYHDIGDNYTLIFKDISDS